MEETLRIQLLTLADAYAGATGCSRATMCKRAINDNTFYSRIANGSGFTIGTFDRMVSWFWANWPAEVLWPDNIERPVKTAEVA